MKKFIQGTYELDKGVTDIVTYEEGKKDEILKIADWCKDSGIIFNVGTAEDNTYLCEYKIKCDTKKECNQLLRELKQRLKGCFPYVRLLFQGSGDSLY